MGKLPVGLAFLEWILRILGVAALFLAASGLVHGHAGSLGKLLAPATSVSGAGGVSQALSGVAAGQGRRIALVIGNGDYQFPENLPKLDNPTNDAQDISAVLRSFGFEVIERKNQTLEAMNQSIAEFGSKLGGSEAALFYFAGHGIQVKNQNYLMPINAKVESEAAVPYQGVDVNRILDEMDNGKSNANIVMLDACRNNPITGKFRSGKSRGLASPGSPPKGTVIVYATDPGNVAADGDGRNGLFTAGLLTAFKGKDLSLDDVLTVASAEVERASGQTQTPYVNGPKTLQKNFHFRVTVEPGRGEVEKTFWMSIERSSDPADFEAYLRKYPKGSYRELAENQIKRLKQSQRPAPTPASVQDNRSAPVAAMPPPVSQAPREDDETRLWNEVKASGAKEYFDAYLKQYPNGKYAALAQSEIRKLDEKTQKANEASKQQDAQRGEQSAWDQAKADGSSAAYASYLERYPKGRYAVLAEAAKQKLQREAAERADAGKAAGSIGPGKTFKDCPDCPEMLEIGVGSFQMGSNEGFPDEKPAHPVKIGKAFALGKTEVTQRQWRAVMGASPHSFKECGDDCPVENVTWDEAQEFARKLSQKTGKSYRLPTEAEWEFACRAGGAHTYCGSDSVDGLGWYASNGGSKSHPVAGKQANSWALHDMSGNVWEWTEDCWNGSYRGAPGDGSAWLSGECGKRVLRGGSWNSGPRYLRAARRSGEATSARSNEFGLRIARTLP